MRYGRSQKYNRALINLVSTSEAPPPGYASSESFCTLFWTESDRESSTHIHFPGAKYRLARVLSPCQAFVPRVLFNSFDRVLILYDHELRENVCNCSFAMSVK